MNNTQHFLNQKYTEILPRNSENSNTSFNKSMKSKIKEILELTKPKVENLVAKTL